MMQPSERRNDVLGQTNCTGHCLRSGISIGGLVINAPYVAHSRSKRELYFVV